MKKDPMEVEDKDTERLKSLKKKAGWDISKAIQYAEAMAKAITDKYKAWRRYKASVDTYTYNSPVTIPFVKRAIELGLPEAKQEWEEIQIYRKERGGEESLSLRWDSRMIKIKHIRKT